MEGGAEQRVGQKGNKAQSRWVEKMNKNEQSEERLVTTRVKATQTGKVGKNLKGTQHSANWNECWS